MHFTSCVCACPNKLGILSPHERGLHVCMGISKWEVFQLDWVAALKLRGLYSPETLHLGLLVPAYVRTRPQACCLMNFVRLHLIGSAPCCMDAVSQEFSKLRKSIS